MDKQKENNSQETSKRLKEIWPSLSLESKSALVARLIYGWEYHIFGNFVRQMVPPDQKYSCNARTCPHYAIQIELAMEVADKILPRLILKHVKTSTFEYWLVREHENCRITESDDADNVFCGEIASDAICLAACCRTIDEKNIGIEELKKKMVGLRYYSLETKKVKHTYDGKMNLEYIKKINFVSDIIHKK